MKELKKRIKGLSAILLAVCLALCLVVRFSGVNTYAVIIKDSIIINANSDNKGDSEYTAQYAMNNEIETKKLSVTGGTFKIKGYVDDLAFMNNGEVVGPNGNYTYVQIKSIPKLEGFVIVGYTESDGENNTKIYTFDIRYEKVSSYNPSIGVGTYYMISGVQYPFSGTGSTYKVQGDPTVYQCEFFYVPRDGAYTILQ